MNSNTEKLAAALRAFVALADSREAYLGGLSEEMSEARATGREALAEHDAAKTPRRFTGAGEPTPDPVTARAGLDPVSRVRVWRVMAGAHIVAEFYGPRAGWNAAFLVAALNTHNGHEG